MKTDYHERREARIDRLRDRADKHKAEENFSDWAVTQAKQILEERVGS